MKYQKKWKTMMNNDITVEIIGEILKDKDLSKDDKKEKLDIIFPNAQKYIAEILNMIDFDGNREGLIDTPYRVVKSWLELYKGYSEKPKEILETTFTDNMEKVDEIVICKDITFSSMCEHHMLPFHGVCHIGYLPDKKVVGLSKLARLVECFSKRLQIQEHLTNQIADSLIKYLAPQGVGVVINAKHLCMSHRGVRNPTSNMITSSMRGKFKDQIQTRNEFLSLIK